MAFVICHLQKFTKGSVIGLQKHNQREQKNYSNANIEKDKTKFNYDLHNNHNIKYLNKIDKIIHENRTNTTRAVRKDAIVMCNTLISASSDFFESITTSETKRYFDTCYEFLKKQFGEKNVISANVHMDETTPHMHFSFVPITNEGALSAKKVMSRPNLRKLQTDLAKYVQDRGFNLERGREETQKNYLDLNTFKKECEINLNKNLEKNKFIEKSIQIKTEELDFLNSKINSIKSDYNNHTNIRSFLSNLEHNCEKEYTGFFEKKETGFIKVRNGYLKDLIEIAETSYIHASNSFETEQILRKNNRNLEEQLQDYKSNFKKVEQLYNTQKYDNSILKSKLDQQEKELNELKFYRNEVADFFNNNLNVVDLFSNFLDEKYKEKVKKKQPKKDFSKTHDNSYDLEL